MREHDVQILLGDVAAEFSKLLEVSAVVLAGSRGSAAADERSDADLYVYAEQEPPETWRADLARRFGEHASIGNHFWETGDEWMEPKTGIIVDIMYRSPTWIAEQMDRVLLEHQASVGYSTCFVYNVLYSKPLYDRDGWFESLRVKAAQPYPEPLRQAVIAKNHPVLRSKIASYEHQIRLAMERGDHVSVNHRVAALLASYFDILFAVNRVYHPGEKRIVAYVLANCPKRPPHFESQVSELLLKAQIGQPVLLDSVDALLDDLDTLLLTERLINQD